MPPQKPPPPPQTYSLAVLLIGLLNTILFTTLYLSSLNANKYYTARHSLEEQCLATHLPPASHFNAQLSTEPSLDCLSYPRPSSISLYSSSSVLPSHPHPHHHQQNQNQSTISRRSRNEKGEQERVFMGKEEAWQYVKDKNCRYPCYSTFGKWVGTGGVGACWGSNGCGVYSCKSPLVEGRIGWKLSDLPEFLGNFGRVVGF